MPKLFFLLIAAFLWTSCHRGAKNQPDYAGRTFHFRLNPPDSSIYRYHTTCETVLTVVENREISRMRRSSHFVIDYLTSKDTSDVMLDMTFGDFDYHEWNGAGSQSGDAANMPGPVRAILNQIKTASIFVRVRRKDQTVTMGGAQELANSGVEPYYAAADRAQARIYWGEWAEEQLVWKNIAPLVWVTLDSVRRLGQRWTDTTTNSEEINFKINKQFRFDSLVGAVATIHSQGLISNDRAGTWLTGRAVKGPLTGSEVGRYLVDTATGMPTEMDEEINAQGNVEIEGKKVPIKIMETIKLYGGKLK